MAIYIVRGPLAPVAPVLGGAPAQEGFAKVKKDAKKFLKMGKLPTKQNKEDWAIAAKKMVALFWNSCQAAPAAINVGGIALAGNDAAVIGTVEEQRRFIADIHDNVSRSFRKRGKSLDACQPGIQTCKDHLAPLKMDVDRFLKEGIAAGKAPRELVALVRAENRGVVTPVLQAAAENAFKPAEAERLKDLIDTRQRELQRISSEVLSSYVFATKDCLKTEAAFEEYRTLVRESLVELGQIQDELTRLRASLAPAQLIAARKAAIAERKANSVRGQIKTALTPGVDFKTGVAGAEIGLGTAMYANVLPASVTTVVGGTLGIVGGYIGLMGAAFGIHWLLWGDDDEI